jgi:magnesium transporter
VTSPPGLPTSLLGGRRQAPAVDGAADVVDCAVYIEGRRLPGKHRPALALVQARARGGFAWLGLHQPAEDRMAAVAATFGLPRQAAQDASQAHQRPKLERYDQTLVLALRTVDYVEHARHGVSEIVRGGEVVVFLDRSFVITVRHGRHSSLAAVRKRLEADPERLALGPPAVLHAIADHVVDSYLAAAARMELEVDAREEEVFTPGNRGPIEPIYQLKREVVELRRSVAPLAAPLQQLSRQSDMPIPTEIRRHLRDLADHHTSVAEQITDFDDRLTTLIGAAQARIGMQQNEDMRKISAWVAIAAVPTMIAGIYGMNFHNMPELSWRFGYPAVLGGTALICLTLFLTFRRNHWL